MESPRSMRSAAARLAAVERWHPEDEEARRAARRDLRRAHAAAHARRAADLLDDDGAPPEAS